MSQADGQTDMAKVNSHCIRRFPLHFPYRASPCTITSQPDSASQGRICLPNFVLQQWRNIACEPLRMDTNAFAVLMWLWGCQAPSFHLFLSSFYDSSTASPNSSSPHSAIKCFLFLLTVPSRFLTNFRQLLTSSSSSSRHI